MESALAAGDIVISAIRAVDAEKLTEGESDRMSFPATRKNTAGKNPVMAEKTRTEIHGHMAGEARMDLMPDGMTTRANASPLSRSAAKWRQDGMVRKGNIEMRKVDAVTGTCAVHILTSGVMNCP